MMRMLKKRNSSTKSLAFGPRWYPKIYVCRFVYCDQCSLPSCLKSRFSSEKGGNSKKTYFVIFFYFKRNMLSQKVNEAKETLYRQDSKSSTVYFNDPKRNNVLDDKTVALHTVVPYLLLGMHRNQRLETSSLATRDTVAPRERRSQTVRTAR